MFFAFYRKWNVSTSMFSWYYIILEEEESLGGYYLYINQFNLTSIHYLVCVTPTYFKEQMYLWETIYQENQLLYSQQEAIAVFISSCSSTQSYINEGLKRSTFVFSLNINILVVSI